MEKLTSFHLQNDEFEIHTLKKKTAQNFDKLANELLELLSQDDNLKFCPDLKINSREEIDAFFNDMEEGIQSDTQYTYFVTRLKTQSIIGEIVLLPPDTAKEKFNVEGVWMIRYILNKRYWDHGIMTSLLSLLFEHLKGKISKLGAIDDPENIASIRLLENLNFKPLKQNGFEKEYYELNLSE
ncbi:MAG: GNAT family N-acetyltransferase [Marinifilaceae bacterium]